MRKLLFAGFASLALLSSCSISKEHSYRVAKDFNSEEAQINRSNFSIEKTYVADLDIDLGKTIEGSTSMSHSSKDNAKNEAYYNAITRNNIHVLVDPIYSLTQNGNKWTAIVSGFGARYTNVRPSSNPVDNSDDGCVVDHIENLERLSKINGVQEGLINSSYVVDSRDGCCDGKSEGKFGESHLIHASETKGSLVDEYLKLVSLCDNTVALNVGSKSTAGISARGMNNEPVNGESSVYNVKLFPWWAFWKK